RPALVATAFFTVVGGAIALRGLPAPPAACGVPAAGAAIARLGPGGQEPALAALEQTTAARRLGTAQGARPVGVLTGERRWATVQQAHGRCCSRGQGGGKRQL